MIKVDIQLQGFEEMKKLLHILPDDLKIKALRPSVRVMGRISLAHAKAKSPYRTGVLRRNIRLIRQKTTTPWEEWNGLRVRTRTRKAAAKAAAKARDNFTTDKRAEDDPYYWFWQEFGFRHRGGKQIEGKRFLRAALDDHTEESISAFRSDFTGRLLGVVKRLHVQQRRGIKR